MYALIGTLYLGKHFVLRQGSTQGIQVPAGRFDELRRAAEADERVPDWLVDAARRQWNINVAGQAHGRYRAASAGELVRLQPRQL
jgi:hypothetical protein